MAVIAPRYLQGSPLCAERLLVLHSLIQFHYTNRKLQQQKKKEKQEQENSKKSTIKKILSNVSIMK